jgi:hypothetical protein
MQSDQFMKLTADLCLVLRLGILGTVPIQSSASLVFKHRDSFSNAVSDVFGCVLGDWGLVHRRGKDLYFYRHV